MSQAYIVDVTRTAGAKKGGKLSHYHPADLGGLVLSEFIQRNNFEPTLIDDVILGCVSQVGAQSSNIARTIVLSANLDHSIPATTIDRQCGSSLQAIHFAAQALMSGTQDIIIAGGIELMSQVPISSNIFDGTKAGHGNPFDGKALTRRYLGAQFNQFIGAELLTDKYQLTREELDQFAYFSHQKAAAASSNGYFSNEILVVPTLNPNSRDDDQHHLDEGIRHDADINQMRGLNPLNEGGKITAATTCQICDGVSYVLMANENGLRKLAKNPKAEIIALALAGTDPVTMLEGPIPATQKALAAANLTVDDIDCFEINEAFASVPLAWQKALNADKEKLNVNGGAIALGHPLGATGAKLMTTLVNELERRAAHYGLIAICEGGGTANACIVKQHSFDKHP